MDAKVVDYLTSYSKKHSGGLLVNRGNTHVFLVININIMEDKNVEIDTKE